MSNTKKRKSIDEASSEEDEDCWMMPPYKPGEEELLQLIAKENTRISILRFEKFMENTSHEYYWVNEIGSDHREEMIQAYGKDSVPKWANNLLILDKSPISYTEV